MSEAQVRATFADLDAWGARVRTPYVPLPGSELATDDLDWPAFPASQVAASGIGAARDHLQAVRVHLEVRPAQLFPFAQATLVRTAMLSAAQAVWVLAPDARSDRVARARTLAQHTYEQHLLFLRDLQALTAAPHTGNDSVAAHVALRLAELRARRAADGQKSKFEATATIEQAALATWGRPELALEAKVEWRHGSGAAHGLSWALLGQAGTTQAGAPDADGVAAFEAAGSIEGLSNPYLCAHGLLVRAWDLLERRGGLTPAS